MSLLGLGAALFFLGLFYHRISEFSFLGGSVKLTPRQVAEAVVTLANTSREALADPEQTRSLVVEFLDTVTPEDVHAAEAFSEDFISQAVDAVQAIDE